MSPLIQNLLTAGFYSSVIIAAVLVLRLILRKAPKRVVCVLWMLAFIRLLMPFQLESKLSLQPEVVPLEETTFYETVLENTSTNDTDDTSPLPNDNSTVTQPVIPENFDGNPTDEEIFSPLESETKDAPAPIHWASMLPYFWMIGASAFLLYAVISYIQLKRTVREAVRIIGCWECDRIETAFILGYIRPRIYVPMGLSRRTRKHILAHEWAHLQTGDHWFKLLAYLACCLHWFNPLVWVAYRLMCKDMEHACDERVVRYMDLDARKQYSHALLTCSTNHSHYTPCPVAFGEVSVKSRILSVLNYRKPGFWITLVAVIAVAFVGVFLMTSPVEEEISDDSEDARETLVTLEKQIHEQEFGKKIEYKPAKLPEPKRTVTVSNVNEFLAAIEPDTEIILKPGKYNLWQASNQDDAVHDYYKWNTVGDGKELELYNVSNLVIRGSGKDNTFILAEPRMAAVLSLSTCSQILLEGFTAGHTTQPQDCSGGVIDLENCVNVKADSLGLYGCGTIGLSVEGCDYVDLANSDIYDCSSMGINVVYTDSFSAENCRIYRIGNRELDGSGLAALRILESNAVRMDNCVITECYVNYLVDGGSGDGITISNTLFENNNVLSIALATYQNELILDNVHVKNNRVGKWFNTQFLYATDSKGNQITEDMLIEANSSTSPDVEQTQVHVSTVDEFLSAIAPNTEIILDAKDFDLSTAKGYGTTESEYYYWYQMHDGPELVIADVDNLTIRGSGQDKTTITAIPRYANVLHFQFCSNITLSGFTAGHSETGAACGGGVIRIDSSEQFTIDNCGLFGCGTIGIDASSSRSITVTECDIYECTTGGIFAHLVNDMEIKNTTFRDLGGYNGMSGYIIAPIECSNIIMDGKEVTDRIEYTGDNTVADFTLTYNNNPVTALSEPLGTFLNESMEQNLSKETTALVLSFSEFPLDGNPPEFTATVGESIPLSLATYPNNVIVPDDEVKWRSSNESIATVTGDYSGCVITGVGVGTVGITADWEGYSTTVTVHIRESW